MGVIRMGVSIENDVLQLLDNYVVDNQFANRSQAIRHLIQCMEVERQWEANGVVAGAVTLLFNQHRYDLPGKLTELRHLYHHIVVCTQFVQLDHISCMEIIAIKGQAYALNEFANQLKALKGIIHSELCMTRLI